ncbi:MAG: hypothetical protein NVS1B1_01350 [Candidatus Limnocylindrales bacterium]
MSAGRTVVIVEDDASTRSALAALLELDGHTVHVARDGPSGVALILQRRPDISLIDVGLPELDGYGVAQLVRADPGGASLRLIALTGYDRIEDRERARVAGFDGHAVKPIGAAALAKLVAD